LITIFSALRPWRRQSLIRQVPRLSVAIGVSPKDQTTVERHCAGRGANAAETLLGLRHLAAWLV
jgi:hypothetical protein